MIPLTIAFVTALVATVLLIRGSKSWLARSVDHQLDGPQKFHTRAVPRVGGAAIVAGAAVAFGLAAPPVDGGGMFLWSLLLCALPTLLAGLWEDLTKNVSPRRRLIATGASAMLAVWLLGTTITRTHIPGVDTLLGWPVFAVALTVLVVTGVANAVNIIDGFNGLASMCVVLMCAAAAYVAFQVGDVLLLTVALTMIGAVLGFFLFNFPAGLIFLGDGGAYFLGFVVSVVGILLVERNPQVSPLFPLLVCGYPIFETLFSIYRKKFIRGTSPGQPDGVHLHMLIYRRVMRYALGEQHPTERRKTVRNSLTSPYLWLLSLTTLIPAVIWWDSTSVLALFIVGFMALYVLLYWSIVRFRTPRWLVMRSSARTAAAGDTVDSVRKP
jgi:UDP-N-acetylmuramyl pentapeptide phosphotransferase/UDP-N-acetylglucosamine-1-phosphate transferase